MSREEPVPGVHVVEPNWEAAQLLRLIQVEGNRVMIQNPPLRIASVELEWVPTNSTDTLLITPKQFGARIGPSEVLLRIIAPHLTSVNLTVVSQVPGLKFYGADLGEGSSKKTSEITLIGGDDTKVSVFPSWIPANRDYLLVGLGDVGEVWLKDRVPPTSKKSVVLSRIDVLIGGGSTNATDAPTLHVGTAQRRNHGYEIFDVDEVRNNVTKREQQEELRLSYSRSAHISITRTSTNQVSRHGTLSMCCVDEPSGNGNPSKNRWYARANSLPHPVTKYSTVRPICDSDWCEVRQGSGFFPIPEQDTCVGPIGRLLGLGRHGEIEMREIESAISSQSGAVPKMKAATKRALNRSTEVCAMVRAGVPFLDAVFNLRSDDV